MDTQPKLQYRAQVESSTPGRWVDGGLFNRAVDAERDAERLHVRHGSAVRVVEVAA